MSRQSAAAKPAGKRDSARDARGCNAGASSARPALTRRESDVIELATLGLTNSQIAQRLNLSTYAIKFHLSSAYGKLGVANRTQAAVAYLNLREADRL